MPGNISGPAPNGRPYTGPGGLAIWANGSPIGVRQNVNYVDRVGVKASVSDDIGNQRTNITWDLDVEQLLGEAIGVNVAVTGDTILVPAITDYQRAHVTRVMFVVDTLNALTSQPTLEVGTDAPGNPPNDDIAPSQVIDASMTSADLVQALTLVNPRTTLDQSAPNNLVRLRITTGAVATTYIATIQVYGVIVTP